jgi:Mg-chelatase subunit ChlD
MWGTFPTCLDRLRQVENVPHMPLPFLGGASMRRPLLLLCAALLAAAPLAIGQPADQAPYKITFETHSRKEKIDGVTVTIVTLNYTITPLRQDDPNNRYEVVAVENNKEMARKTVPIRRVTEGLSAVAALDVSASMAKGGRMEQVRAAARVFFDKVPAASDLGLILFDDEMKLVEPLTQDRQRLVDQILKAQPGGGTAYLDAAIKGIQMLDGVKHRKAVVVMTDGWDLNSTATPKAVINLAKKKGVNLYTVGIGESGRQEKVTSVLVLDTSGSMKLPADDRDKLTKIEALKVAANRFLSFVRESNPPIIRTSVLDFSNTPTVPMPFTNDRSRLRQRINNISAAGETALFDATYEAIAALEAERPSGHRAVVALTDGVDNSSRRRVDEVITRARQARIPLYMLGFGRQGELDTKVMERMALETGGKFFHARNQKALMEIFEKLGNELHDDGIDEKTLKELASETGGKYFHAKDVNQLRFILRDLAVDMQAIKDEVTFHSLVPDWGVHVPYDLKLVRVAGKVGQHEEIVVVVSDQVVRHGLVVASSNHFVYLFFLLLFGLLLVLPGRLQRRTRSEG